MGVSMYFVNGSDKATIQLTIGTPDAFKRFFRLLSKFKPIIDQGGASPFPKKKFSLPELVSSIS